MTINEYQHMINKNETLAVIIPVYKVEPYIRQCIESVINQTYPHLRIILVDDGSPDNCGMICDEYAKKDARIQVIHKINGGLSSARNAGMSLVHDCEFITFVDSDDWMETCAYEICMEYLQQHPEADILCFGMNEITEHATKCYKEHSAVSFTQKEALLELAQGFSFKVSPTVWNKIFRKSIIQDIHFLEGRLYEDNAFLFEALWHSQQYHLLPYAFYNYRLGREGSITIEKELQIVDLYQNLEESLQGKDKEYALYLNTKMVNWLWMHWYRFYKHPSFSQLSSLLLPYIQRARKRPYINVYKSRIMGIKTWLFLHYPFFYSWLTLKLLKRKS